MSKLMGKNILKVENCREKVAEAGLFVRYLKSTDAFEFRGFRVQLEKAEEELVASCGMTLKEVGEKKDKLVVAADVVLAMMMADKVEAVYAKWSYGYKTVEKLGAYPGEMAKLKENEYQWIRSYCYGGKVIVDLDLPEDDYFDLSVWQYVFNLSAGFFDKVKKQWKRCRWGRAEEAWVPASVRHEFCGRKKGALGKNRGSDVVYEESLADFMARVEHNQKIALEKGIVGWYMDMEREKCKRFGGKFGKEEKEKALVSWNKKRNER